MRSFESLSEDFRGAVWILLQNPSFAAITILSPVLGLGANTLNPARNAKRFKTNARYNPFLRRPTQLLF
jgi:hypothetical protein